MICKTSQYLLNNYMEQGRTSGICRLSGG